MTPPEADRDAFLVAALPEEAPRHIDVDGIIDAAQAAWWDIEHAPASAWGSHIPFLFSLISLTRPRSFVELGVQRGASFFAACQAVDRLMLATTCVAIDNWIGDPHAGESADGEFEAVRSRIADKYEHTARYIRGQFDDAAKQFEERSIDLLHVDGLHTAEAVTHDFERWRSKLSNRGIVLFHDINEYRGDFGAWRFWRDAREKFPSFEFGHGHGLGVLFVGADAVKTLGDAGELIVSPVGRQWLQVFFGGAGHTSWQLAQARRRANELNSLRDQMHERNKAVEQLRSERDRALEENSKLPRHADIRDRDRRIRELETRLADAQKQASAVDLIRQGEGQVRVRDKRLRERGAQIALLRDQVSEAELRVAALRASTSWRLTSPVRAVGRSLRRLRRR